MAAVNFSHSRSHYYPFSVLKLTETQTQHDAIVEKKREKLAQYLKIVAGHEKVVEENASDCKQALLKARQVSVQLVSCVEARTFSYKYLSFFR
jgi:hypothetical protein